MQLRAASIGNLLTPCFITGRAIQPSEVQHNIQDAPEDTFAIISSIPHVSKIR